MAIKPTWPVSHACGHTTTHDLSSKPADKRAGLARWLSHKDCTNCWRSGEADGQTRPSKQDRITQQRAQESAAIADWEQQRAMPKLHGSAKARDWAARARHCLLRAAYEAHVESGAMQEVEFDALIETPAKRITDAAGWIDNRDTNPDDIPELLEAAKRENASTGNASTGTENPY
jgi:hypothetical protein